METTLPTDSAERKAVPLWSGCVRYFVAALAGVARISKTGNEKHNPGEPMHHARGKSSDHTDCAIRHMADAEDLIAAYERDPSVCAMEGGECKRRILDEADQAAWRVLAWSQELHEKYGGAPLAPGARLPARDKPSEPAPQLSSLRFYDFAGATCSYLGCASPRVVHTPVMDARNQYRCARHFFCITSGCDNVRQNPYLKCAAHMPIGDF